ncbi:MAG: hypothetical protein ACT4O1_08035 [Gemmatimonadota bacterium]
MPKPFLTRRMLLEKRPIGNIWVDTLAGYKFDCWHDVVFWYLRLRALPDRPHELLPLSRLIGTMEWNHAIEKQTSRF